MSYEMEFSCHLYGINLDLASVLNLSEIEILSSNSVGDILDVGVYKDKPSPYASIDFTSIGEDFESFIERLYKAKELLVSCGADDKEIIVTIRYFNQCNMEFDAQTLYFIGDMGLTLCISCYKDDEVQDG